MPIKNNNMEYTLIAEKTFIEGTIEVEGNIRIDGRLKGKLVVKGNLTIGKTGIIEAEVEADNCVLAGKITGNVTIKNKMEIEEKAVLIGDLKTRELIINEKAIFNGFCKMIENPQEVEKTFNTK